MPVNQAFIKVEIIADDGSANSSEFDRLSISVRMRPCLMKRSWPFSALMRRSRISLVSLLQRIKSDCRICSDCAFYLNSTDVFWCLCLCLCSLSVSPKCLCSFVQHLSPTFDFRCLFLPLLSPSCFKCFVGDVFLVDSCAFSAACDLNVTWVQFYFKTGGTPYALQRLVDWKLQYMHLIIAINNTEDGGWSCRKQGYGMYIHTCLITLE